MSKYPNIRYPRIEDAPQPCCMCSEQAFWKSPKNGEPLCILCVDKDVEATLKK